jgi:hypothetical protein
MILELDPQRCFRSKHSRSHTPHPLVLKMSFKPTVKNYVTISRVLRRETKR